MTEKLRTEDLHIVVAALESQGQFVGYTAVTGPLTYNEALEVWERKERFKGGGKVRGKGHVRHYAVRSVADPRFAPLISRGYADAVRRPGSVSPSYERGIEKAAKAWAKEFGYTGRAGGWIYDASGDPVTQGWFSFAGNLRCLNRIAEGADGKWYVIDKELVK